MKCTYCHARGCIKAGRNPSGTQIYKCKSCQRKFTPNPSYHGYSDQLRQKALMLYATGKSFRQIGRLLSINHQTIANWINGEANSRS